ncbi:MAG: alanine racemase [Treponema sp.]|nr:alanine racemase [Treponema sp.]
MRATVAKIHIKNFEHNINLIKNHIKKGTKICIPVKAEGYGHGSIKIAQIAQKNAIDYLAVATIDEAVLLRKNQITLPILLLSIPQISEISNLIKMNLEPLVFSEQYILALQNECKKQNINVKVHLKIDTGMGRIGCSVENCVEIAQIISNCSNLVLQGICTHFPVSDSIIPEDVDFTKKQIKIFSNCVEKIRSSGINPGIIHAANSGCVLAYPESNFSMVRPGIIVYGFPPDMPQYEQILNEKKLNDKLKPVMELETCVSAILPHKKGDTISYGRTYILTEDADIAVLPIGYADGLLRRFSPGLKVKINGKIFDQVGRICMDQCMINLKKNSGVKVDDRVTIFSDGIDFISANDIALRTNTISYEILCGISKRVPRIYIE